MTARNGCDGPRSVEPAGRRRKDRGVTEGQREGDGSHERGTEYPEPGGAVAAEHAKANKDDGNGRGQRARRPPRCPGSRWWPRGRRPRYSCARVLRVPVVDDDGHVRDRHAGDVRAVAGARIPCLGRGGICNGIRPWVPDEQAGASSRQGGREVGRGPRMPDGGLADRVRVHIQWLCGNWRGAVGQDGSRPCSGCRLSSCRRSPLAVASTGRCLARSPAAFPAGRPGTPFASSSQSAGVPRPSGSGRRQGRLRMTDESCGDIARGRRAVSVTPKGAARSTGRCRSLRDWRDSLGLCQGEVAAWMGVSQVWVSQTEREPQARSKRAERLRRALLAIARNRLERARISRRSETMKRARQAWARPAGTGSWAAHGGDG